jgi:uncharacterized protein YqeY
MSLLEQIDTDLNTALKARDQKLVSTLRLLKNSLKNQRINSGKDLNEADELAILQKEAKQRRESITSFNQAGRTDLVAQEEAELTVIEKYLPTKLSEAELSSLIEEAIAETGASTISDMGKVMGNVSPKIAGRADGAQVANLVKQKLSV